MRTLPVDWSPGRTATPRRRDRTSRSLPARTSRVLRLLLVLTCATAFVGLLPLEGRASTVLYRTDAELIALSERVVHARVLHQRVERPGGNQGAIYTVSTLAVLEDFTGVAGDTIDVWELGGAVGREAMFVGGAVNYQVGSEVLVCLGRGRHGLRSVAMGFSKFDIAPATAADGSADGRLTRNMRDTSVVGGPPAPPERSLSDFRALAAAVRGIRSVRNQAAASLVPDLGVSDAFTLLTFSNGLGPRWVEADFNTPVRYYRNTAAPSPLLSGDVDSEIQKALSAWTGPASASITLRYAGTTTLAQPREPITSNGAAVISFEDPDDELSNPTLAIGGGFASLGDGGIVNGATFNRFTSAYVIFQNAADLPASFREPQNFSRVLEHEVGHTIGLGHSADASSIMYASCCSTATPVAPALGADDLAGLNFIYPSGANGTCSFLLVPSSVSVTAAATSGMVTVVADAV